MHRNLTGKRKKALLLLVFLFGFCYTNYGIKGEAATCAEPRQSRLL